MDSGIANIFHEIKNMRPDKNTQLDTTQDRVFVRIDARQIKEKRKKKSDDDQFVSLIRKLSTVQQKASSDEDHSNYATKTEA